VSWSRGARRWRRAQPTWCSPWRNPPDPPASTSTARPPSTASSSWYGPCCAGWGGRLAHLPAHPADPFSGQEPRISALHPPFGPRGGGTLLSLRGTHLSAGSSWLVMVNGSECPLAEQPRYPLSQPCRAWRGPWHGNGHGHPLRSRCPLQPWPPCPQTGRRGDSVHGSHRRWPGRSLGDPADRRRGVPGPPALPVPPRPLRFSRRPQLQL